MHEEGGRVYPRVEWKVRRHCAHDGVSSREYKGLNIWKREKCRPQIVMRVTKCWKGKTIGRLLPKKEWADLSHTCRISQNCKWGRRPAHLSTRFREVLYMRRERGGLKNLAESIDGMGPKTNDLQAREAIIGNIVITAKAMNWLPFFYILVVLFWY